MDFVGQKNWFFIFSLLIIVPGIVFLIISPGLKPGIDFTGGSATTIEFSEIVEQDNLREELAKLDHPDAIIQKLGDNTYFVRTKLLGDSSDLVDPIKVEFGGDVQALSFDLVSPVVASETVVNAMWAVLAAAVGIFFYVWWAFRKLPSPLKYGAAAIVALVHDTMVVVSIFAALGVLFAVEVSTMFLIALLTVIGYSVNDTIVVFDRLRENILLYPNRTLSASANLSISETLGRSLNTSFTLLFAVLALLLFGGATIKVFLWVLLIGVIAGTYSSIAIATPVLVMWESGVVGRFFRRLFRRLRPSRT